MLCTMSRNLYIFPYFPFCRSHLPVVLMPLFEKPVITLTHTRTRTVWYTQRKDSTHIQYTTPSEQTEKLNRGSWILRSSTHVRTRKNM